MWFVETSVFTAVLHRHLDDERYRQLQDGFDAPARARTDHQRVRWPPQDRAWPLVPSWAIVYGALYLFLVLLPVFVVRQDELIRRTVYAYLLIWIIAYAFFFVLYPTAAPRPNLVIGEGFAVWGLRALYSADPPHNCFPSLHVAHSLVSALAVSRVHRRLGIIACISGLLVAISTLFTK